MKRWITIAVLALTVLALAQSLASYRLLVRSLEERTAYLEARLR